MKKMIIISNRKKITLRQKMLMKLFHSTVQEWMHRDAVINYINSVHSGFIFLNLTGVEEKETLHETISGADDDRWFRTITLHKFILPDLIKSLISDEDSLKTPVKAVKSRTDY